MSKLNVNSGIGPVITGMPTAAPETVTPQKIQNRAEITPLQVGFERDKGLGAKVLQDGAKVQNPILDGDEELPAFEERGAKGMAQLATKMALQFEDFGGQGKGAGGEGLAGFAEYLMEQGFTPDETGTAKLQELANAASPEVPEGAAAQLLRSSLSKQFGVKLPDDTPFGQLGLMAGLASAGVDPASFMLPNGDIDTDKLAGELADVVREGGSAIQTAVTMASGINVQVGQARTFIGKH
jgi:hypothetical protein